MNKHRSFSQTLLSSYFWVMLGQWGVRSLGIISTLILVRLLQPDDFGLIAQSTVVIMFFEALTQSGADNYIIKLKNAAKEDLMTAWTLNFLLRTLACLIIILFASPLAEFMGDVRLKLVLQLSAITAFFQNFKSPTLILFRKELKFKQLSIMNMLVKMLSFLVTVALALYLHNYWALLWANAVSVLCFVVASYWLAPTMPSFTFAKLKEQISFSKGILLNCIFGYIRSKADIFIVSKKFSTASVGYYSIAQEFSLLPLTEVVSPIMAPLFSSFSKIIDDQEQLEDKVFKYLSLAYAFLIPATVGIIFLSKQIVSIVLGASWIHSAPVLANLSLLMIVFLTNNVFKQIFILRAQFKSLITIDIVGVLLIIIALFWDDISNVIHFSQYRVVVGVFVIFSTVYLAKIVLGFRMSTLFIASIVPIISSLLMLSVLALAYDFTILLSNIYFETFSLVITGAIVYFLSFIGLVSLLKSKHTIWLFQHSIVLLIKQKVVALF